MSKDKVIHARISDDIHDKLFEKCNELWCSFTDYIQSIITASLEEDPSDIGDNKNFNRLTLIIEMLYDRLP